MSCKTFFKWNSLKIINRSVHNPDYIRDLENGTANVREIGDVLCGRELDMEFIYSLLNKLDFGDKLLKISRYVDNIDEFKYKNGFREHYQNTPGPMYYM